MIQPCPVASYLGIGRELEFELEVLLKEDEEEIGGVDENVLLGLFARSGLGGFDLVARLAKACFFHISFATILLFGVNLFGVNLEIDAVLVVVKKWTGK